MAKRAKLQYFDWTFCRIRRIHALHGGVPEEKVLVPKYDMVQMATFNREIVDLTFVFSRFVSQKTDLTKELLKKILQGHALPTEDPEAERCRNYLLQLRAAVYFMDLGFDVSVNADADVVANHWYQRKPFAIKSGRCLTSC